VSASVQAGMVVVTLSFDPLIAQLGPFQLGWHGLFSTLALLVALWLATRLAAHRGLPIDPVVNVALWGVAGGIVGARVFHVLDHLEYFALHPLEAVAVWQGGIAVYGAFIGGVAADLVAARRARLPVWRLLDVAAPAMLVGQAIGRLGCLSNGDAWELVGAQGTVYRTGCNSVTLD
jgi:phosphatidylglycerol---prolipoprotein diacylglyceryl transferase